MPKIEKHELEEIYAKYNRRECVHPDPLEFLYAYEDMKDREIAGFIASSLAYGRVSHILSSVSSVLEKMGKSPFVFLTEASLEILYKNFAGFKHRFATDKHIVKMLIGIKQVIKNFGSLYACFLSGLNQDDETVITALSIFAKEIADAAENGQGHLIPMPSISGSACKRLNLFLRWMVRKDAVDPGGWDDVPASKLIIPLDVHMHRFCLEAGLTAKKSASMKTALEITAGFRKISPNDPVRYDFALTRPGIQKNSLMIYDL